MPSGLANTLVAPGTGETIDWLPSVGFTAITPPFPPQQVESTTRMTWPEGPVTRATPRGVRRLPPEEMTVWLDVGGPSGSTTMTAASGASTVTMRSPDLKVTAPAGPTSIWIARASTSPAIAALGPTWRRGRSGDDRPRRLRRIIGGPPSETGPPRPCPGATPTGLPGNISLSRTHVAGRRNPYRAPLDSLGDGPSATADWGRSEFYPMGKRRRASGAGKGAPLAKIGRAHV